jgi:hypothetical protein
MGHARIEAAMEMDFALLTNAFASLILLVKIVKLVNLLTLSNVDINAISTMVPVSFMQLMVSIDISGVIATSVGKVPLALFLFVAINAAIVEHALLLITVLVSEEEQA